jgi:hypothetical protein
MSDNGKGENNAEFVIEEMNKETAEIFAKLQLGNYGRVPELLTISEKSGIIPIFEENAERPCARFFSNSWTRPIKSYPKSRILQFKIIWVR